MSNATTDFEAVPRDLPIPTGAEAMLAINCPRRPAGVGHCPTCNTSVPDVCNYESMKAAKVAAKAAK